jgi:hypothetical protein
VTDDTAAFIAAVNATPPGSALIIPTARACFRITAPLVITKAIGIRGEGWASDSWGMRFGEAGFLAHFHGSVLCSTVTSGVALKIATPAAGLHFADFAVIGTGTGTATGISFGDDRAAQYLNQGTVTNVVAGNFGNGITIFSQNSAYYGLKAEGAAPAGVLPVGAGIYFGTNPAGTPNANHLSGLVVAGGNRVDLYVTGQSNDITGFDLENPAPDDPTSVSLELYNCNECSASTGYIESGAGQNYTGESVLVTGPEGSNNAIGATLTNLHISTTAAFNSLHIGWATHTTVIGGQMGRIVLEPNSCPANLLFDDYSGSTVINRTPNCATFLDETGILSGTATLH